MTQTDQTSSPPTGQRQARRAARNFAMLLILGLAVHLLLPQLTALRHSVQVFQSMLWWAVGLALAAQILSYAGSGYLLRSIALLFGERLSLQRSMLITMASTSLGVLWGGQLTYASATFRWMRGSGVPSEGALVTGWLAPLINIFTLSAVSIFGLVYLLSAHKLSQALVIGFAGAVLLLGCIAGLAAWGLRHQAGLTALLKKVGARWARLLHRAYDPVAAEQTTARLFGAWDLLRRGGWRGPLLGDALNVGFDILTLFFLFTAAGNAVSPGILLAGYGLPLLLGKVTILPGGVGIVEGSMAALYSVLGVPGPMTVVVILSYRILSFWLPISIGIPLIPYLNRIIKPRQEPEPCSTESA